MNFLHVCSYRVFIDPNICVVKSVESNLLLNRSADLCGGTWLSGPNVGRYSLS
jgi:hypothetical protein